MTVTALQQAAAAAAAGRTPAPPPPQPPPPVARIDLWRLVPRKFKALRRMLGEPPQKRKRKTKAAEPEPIR